MAPSVPAEFKLHWSQKIESYVDQAHQCAKARNFTFFHASNAHYIAQSAADVSKDDQKKLVDMNIDVANECDTAANKMVADLKAFLPKSNEPDAIKTLDWEQKIMDEFDILERDVHDKLTKVKDSAVALISKLPPAVQDSAADFFVKCVSLVTQVLDAVYDKLETLVQYIAQFLKGVWTALTSAYNFVKNVVTSCIGSLNKLITGSALAKGHRSLSSGVSSSRYGISTLPTKSTFTGSIFEIFWPKSYDQLSVNLTSLYLMSEYRKLENQYDVWISAVELSSVDDKWHALWKVTNCPVPERAEAAMMVVLDAEKKRISPLHDKVYKVIHTPDEIDFTNLLDPSSSYGTIGTGADRNEIAPNNDDNAIHHNYVVELSFDRRVPSEEMTEIAQAIWNTYKDQFTGRFYQEALITKPVEFHNGRYLVLIKWSPIGDDSREVTRMGFACDMEVAAAELKYFGSIENPLEYKSDRTGHKDTRNLDYNKVPQINFSKKAAAVSAY
ncbi:MAG: hypothetical protein Q9167_007327 [Letrouitia subvulpina]